jgi:hypothetical protein
VTLLVDPDAPQVAIEQLPELGVIEEARARQRRRRMRAVATLGVLGALTAVLLTSGAAHKPRPSPQTLGQPARHIPTAPSSAVLAEEPYMGVACSIPNSIACDRVGLSIRLRTRAYSATATIDGRALSLDNRLWSDPPLRGRHESLGGFLQPAGLKNGALKTTTDSRGDPQPVTATIHLIVDYGGGRKIQTTTAVGLHAGWG